MLCAVEFFKRRRGSNMVWRELFTRALLERHLREQTTLATLAGHNTGAQALIKQVLPTEGYAFWRMAASAIQIGKRQDVLIFQNSFDAIRAGQRDHLMICAVVAHQVTRPKHRRPDQRNR